MRPGRSFAITMPGRMTLQKQFESGVSHYRAGRLAEAEKIYRQILALSPISQSSDWLPDQWQRRNS